jgi:TRAP-type C4-dicarboxylate transport system substrate-binding protein
MSETTWNDLPRHLQEVIIGLAQENTLHELKEVKQNIREASDGKEAITKQYKKDWKNKWNLNKIPKYIYEFEVDKCDRMIKYNIQRRKRLEDVFKFLVDL